MTYCVVIIVRSPGKSEAIYTETLRLLKDACIERRQPMSPEILSLDFETACIEAFKYHWPGIRVQGCYFHYAQALKRNWMEIGLTEAMRDHEAVRLFIKSFIGLSLVPLDRVEEAFDTILSTKQQLTMPPSSSPTHPTHTTTTTLLRVAPGRASSIIDNGT